MGRYPSILIVDDEPGVLMTLRLIFEDRQYSVITAVSCAAALSVLRRHERFDVILTDLCLEKDDIGLEVAAVAAKLRPRPIIVVMTGFSSVENARAALHVPVDHYATKPLNVDELLNAISRLLMSVTRLEVG